MNNQQTNTNRAIEKIKKCLALARSTNPNEAATALRQAHALMKKHGVSSHEITMSDIGEAETISTTTTKSKPARWESSLVSTIGKAFGCGLMIRRGQVVNVCSYVFVGLKHNAEIAAYVAEITIRKCKKARQKWLKENMAGFNSVAGGKAKMTRLGDTFAEGWCSSVARVIHEFANPQEVETAIADYLNRETEGKEAKSRAPKKDEHQSAAVIAGIQAGKGVSLHHGMHTAEKPLSIGLEA
jgi:hypothetical protein